MIDELAIILENVIKPSLSKIEVDIGELQRELIRHESRAEGENLPEVIRELRQDVTNLLREVSELRGSMEGFRLAIADSNTRGRRPKN